MVACSVHLQFPRDNENNGAGNEGRPGTLGRRDDKTRIRVRGEERRSKMGRVFAWLESKVIGKRNTWVRQGQGRRKLGREAGLPEGPIA